MQGDDLSILLFWLTLAVTFGYEAVKAETAFRRGVLGALAAVFLLSGIFWLQLKKVWPPLTEAMASIASSPQSWFVLFIFISAIVVFGRPQRGRREIPETPLIPGVGHGNQSELVVQLARQVSEMQGQLDSVSATHSATTMAAADLINGVEERIAKIENSPVEAIPNLQTNRDILLLTHFAVYQSTLHMLDSLLTAAPTNSSEGPLQLGGDFSHQNDGAKKFIELVRRKLDPGSYRRSNFESVMTNAASFAEHELEQTPMDRRPDGIDPLVLRRWVIAHRQCSSAVAFLRRERQEIDENLLGQRHNLLQRYIEQNK